MEHQFSSPTKQQRGGGNKSIGAQGQYPNNSMRDSIFSTPKKKFANAPTSPENSRFSSTSNAPSPRTLPRSLSRSSEDEERRIRGNSSSSAISGLSSYSVTSSSTSDWEIVNNKSLSAHASHQNENNNNSKRIALRPPDWNWEYSSDRIGIYDLPSRRARIEKYREKRRHLTFRQVRYSARSNICQKRERVGGRFVKTDRVIRADTQALMHPEAVLRTNKKKLNDKTELKSVAELMVELSKGLISNNAPSPTSPKETNDRTSSTRPSETTIST